MKRIFEALFFSFVGLFLFLTPAAEAACPPERTEFEGACVQQEIVDYVVCLRSTGKSQFSNESNIRVEAAVKTALKVAEIKSVGDFKKSVAHNAEGGDMKSAENVRRVIDQCYSIANKTKSPYESKSRDKTVNKHNKLKIEDKATLENILNNGCYTRALFTRTHAQLSHEAMFKSIGTCRQKVQANVSKIKDNKRQRAAADILSALDAIEREGQKKPYSSENIDKLKLGIIKAFGQWAKDVGLNYIFPKNLTEEVFFTEEEANKAPSL